MLLSEELVEVGECAWEAAETRVHAVEVVERDERVLGVARSKHDARSFRALVEVPQEVTSAQMCLEQSWRRLGIKLHNRKIETLYHINFIMNHMKTRHDYNGCILVSSLQGIIDVTLYSINQQS